MFVCHQNRNNTCFCLNFLESKNNSLIWIFQYLSKSMHHIITRHMSLHSVVVISILSPVGVSFSISVVSSLTLFGTWNSTNELSIFDSDGKCRQRFSNLNSFCTVSNNDFKILLLFDWQIEGFALFAFIWVKEAGESDGELKCFHSENEKRNNF